MKRFLTIITLLLPMLAVSVGASAYGIDPVADSLAVKQMQARMDSIRQHRPVVALVLSGGGAKGASHIGAIRRIEEIGIPVDMVLGTSMGGLVGGLLSLGYSPDEMEQIVCSADWGYLLTEKLPRQYKSLSEMKYRAVHQISIPFYYEKDFFMRKKEEDLAEEKAQRLHKGIELGAEGDFTSKDNFMASLPASYVSGQNVSNLFNSLTVGYSDTLDFINLPIPFCSTAADMISFKPKRWYSGRLSDALRSTMSIPVLFAPVRTEGMVLVDGGMRDNYPVALARELGADIVIGVELSDAKKTYSEVNNLLDVISQGIDMLGADAFNANENAADVKIKPDLHEYNMLSFSNESIPIIIKRGYDAAEAADSALLAVKAKVGDATLEFQAHKATDISQNYVRVNEIEILGVTDTEEEWLMKHVGLMPGGLVNKAKMDNIVGIMRGLQTFESITYEFLGESEPYKLVLNCRKGPIHQFGLGVRFDTEEIVTAHVNLGLNVRKLQGVRFDFNGKVSVNPYMDFLFSYDNPRTPTFNLEANVRYSGIGMFNFGAGEKAISPDRLEMNFWKFRADFFISNISWKQIDLKGGVRTEYFLTNGLDTDRYAPMYDTKQTRADYMTVYLDAMSENYDKYYFPTKGHSLSLYYGWTFAGFPKTDFSNFHTFAFNGRFVIPAGKVLTIIPSFNMRYTMSMKDFRDRKSDPGAASNIPIMFMNMMGGSLQGRYIEQQVPFIGLNYATCVDNIMGIARTDFQLKVAKNHYVTGMVNYAHDAHSWKGFLDGRNYFGGGFQYAYNSIIGPIAIDLHWSNMTRYPGIYASVGYNF